MLSKYFSATFRAIRSLLVIALLANLSLVTFAQEKCQDITNFDSSF